jgi:hypothetical protein
LNSSKVSFFFLLLFFIVKICIMNCCFDLY